MDIYVLLDQLEQLANDSKKIRFSNKIMIDDDELLDLIDQLRTAVPDEVRQSKRMLAERERIIAAAQSEADRMVKEAEQRAVQIVDDEKLKVEAERRANNILAEANATAEAVRTGADEYAMEVLKGLDQTLTSFLGHIRNGLSELDTDRVRR